MTTPSKEAVVPGVEKENLNSPLGSPPCNPGILRSALTKSARKGDRRTSATQLKKRLGIRVDQDKDNLDTKEKNEIERFLAQTEENNNEWVKETNNKLAQIESSLKLVREDQVTSLNNQENMLGRLATIEAMMKSANPHELEKLRKEKDNIQRQLVITTKRNVELLAKIAAMEKQHEDLQDAYDRVKAGGKTRISRPSVVSSFGPSYPQRTQGSITKHVGKERAMLNYKQSVNDGSVKQAPAFGPGRRHPNGEISLSKKNPFKL